MFLMLGLVAAIERDLRDNVLTAEGSLSQSGTYVRKGVLESVPETYPA
jgi:hypothetical protein